MEDDIKCRIEMEEQEQINLIADRLKGKSIEQKRIYLIGYIDSISYHSDHQIGMELAQTPKYSKYLIRLLTDSCMQKEADYLKARLKITAKTFRRLEMMMENLTE